MQESKRGGGGWIGWLIFFFLVFGSNFLPPVASWLTQVTGIPISAPMIIVGMIVLSVVWSVASSVITQVLRSRGANESSLPPPPTMAPPSARSAPPPSRPAPPPPTIRLPPPSSAGGLQRPRLKAGEQRLPGPPRFEPIIDPRILTFGIVGMAILGVFFVVVLALSGSLP